VVVGLAVEVDRELRQPQQRSRPSTAGRHRARGVRRGAARDRARSSAAGRRRSRRRLQPAEASGGRLGLSFSAGVAVRAERGCRCARRRGAAPRR
jgi:hypothetical protein